MQTFVPFHKNSSDTTIGKPWIINSRVMNPCIKYTLGFFYQIILTFNLLKKKFIRFEMRAKTNHFKAMVHLEVGFLTVIEFISYGLQRIG